MEVTMKKTPFVISLMNYTFSISTLSTTRPKIISKAIIKTIIVTLFLAYLPCVSTKAQPGKKSEEPIKKNYVVLIDVNECRLFLIDSDTKEIIKNYPVALGRLDLPSPMGTWKIINKGHWDEGFGGRWLGLNVPWGTYGIHGTSKPSSIGSYASHGCIRMFNSDVKELYNYVSHGTTVIIYGGSSWLFTSYSRTILPGDRGADVYDVQRRLKDLGYYKGTLDGIYGEGMKAVVIKFRKDNNLSPSHNVDKDLLKALEIYKFE